MVIINKYDGTPETDYEIKVERVNFDEKTEKEQMTYMAVGNTKADYNLIADYIDQVDYSNIGITEDEYNQILDLRDDVDGVDGFTVVEDGLVNTPMFSLPINEKSNNEILEMHESKPKMTKEQVKEEKNFCKNVASDRQSDMNLYIVVKFSSIEEKQAFCDMNGLVCDNNMTIDGVELMDKLDEA